METLEQELQARTFLHKVAIVGGALMKEYLQENSKGITLPPHILEEEADKYSNRVIQKSLQHGTFEALYNEIWSNLKSIIPDNLKLI